MFSKRNDLHLHSIRSLAPLFDYWKVAGKKSSSCVLWLDANYSVNGVVLTTASHTVTFDANGDWTFV